MGNQRTGTRDNCDVAVDLGDPALPVAGTGKLSHIRKSKNSKRRAMVLLAVHLLLAAHITHFLVARRTLSPVEPSEAMYTLELGQLNAGFIFLIVALLATLIFGRFFCGWGCHLVALQDICGWLMKKLGVRPRPFRSRLLVFVPLGVALYMFVWPTVRRVVLGGGGDPFPGFSNHLMTTNFWETFPGPIFTALTFLSCGFAAVYFLGAKGFCTYGCPYGGLFGIADAMAPGSIVVSDACEQCGHCTATCTSNVLVHEEVRLHGQVVDPGCMKCMDCVSVCPKGALSYRFSRPSVFKGRPSGPPGVKRFSFSFAEEIFLLTTCVGGTLAFRGLYDGPPLLMSVGLGGITAFLALKLWHLLRRPTVRLQNLKLKLAGSVGRAGWVFAGLTMLWLLLTAHSAFAQWHRAWGRYHMERTEAARADVLSGTFVDRRYSTRHARAAARSLRHFRLADRWGLVDVVEVKLGLAWGHLLHDDFEAAAADVRRAVRLAPERPQPHDNLVHLLSARGRWGEAVEAQREKMAWIEPTAQDHFRLGGLLVESGKPDQAVEAYARSVALAPEVAVSHYNFGGLLRRLGRYDEAIEQLRQAARLAPDDADTQVELALAYQAAGDREAALACLTRAIELAPDRPESRLYLPDLIRQLRASTDD